MNSVAYQAQSESRIGIAMAVIEVMCPPTLVTAGSRHVGLSLLLGGTAIGLPWCFPGRSNAPLDTGIEPSLMLPSRLPWLSCSPGFRLSRKVGGAAVAMWPRELIA
jgi:hypothetical protein